MKTGIYGGTFNPPHLGHLIVADHVAHELSLDRIIFIPSYISPHKQAGEEQGAAHRLAMVRLAVQGHPRFEVSDIEVRREGTSYTIDTLMQLRSQHPDDEFFLLIGADNVSDFRSWKSYQAIPGLATIVAMNRPTYQLPAGVPMPPGMISVEVPNIQISSSEIRRKVREKKDVRYLLPESVLNYVEKCRLYTEYLTL